MDESQRQKLAELFAQEHVAVRDREKEIAHRNATSFRRDSGT